jgi:hypothetical protein
MGSQGRLGSVEADGRASEPCADREPLIARIFRCRCHKRNPGAPVAGANSFTEGQAKSRIESHGYGNVNDLKKDDSGVWRGKAMKDGKSVDVSLDFQGNVVAR